MSSFSFSSLPSTNPRALRVQYRSKGSGPEGQRPGGASNPDSDRHGGYSPVLAKSSSRNYYLVMSGLVVFALVAVYSEPLLQMAGEGTQAVGLPHIPRCILVMGGGAIVLFAVMMQ